MAAIIDGLLLAAGYSSRMGEFKPLMEHDGRPFVVGIAGKMSRVCRRVIVVLGYRANDIRAAFAGIPQSTSVEFVENPHFEQGMFTSLQTGAGVLHDAEWVLYHFCDQPHLPAEFYENLVRRIEPDCDGIQPVHGGQKGHPVLLNRALMDSIRQASGQSTLRDVLINGKAKMKNWECSFPQVLSDWDTPDDIEQSRTQRPTDE